MTHFVGLDVSKATTSICILDQRGQKVREGVVETEPGAIIGYLRGEGRRYRRIGIESMSFTPWLYEAQAKAGLPIICIEARHARSVLKGRLNKTDRNDAQGIAELMRTGVYKAVHIKTRRSQEAKLLLAARRLLRFKVRDIDNLVRGALLQSGLKIRPRQVYSFDQRAELLLPATGVLRDVVGALLTSRRALEAQIERLEDLIERAVAADPVCQRLMTAPGVGPLTSLAYRAAIDVPERFARSRDVGVHLGLTPGAFRSGTIERRQRISKCGDQAARSALFLAAQSVLRTRTRETDLKRWGVQVAASRGALKATVAVARRLAVILHRMWCDGTDFRQSAEP
jgi:transposase